MKKVAVRLFFVCLAALTALAMASCGEESKTKALFEKLDKDSGIHMKYSLQTGDKTTANVYIKGENAYVDVELNGAHSISILKDGVLTVLDPQTKTGTQTKLTDEQKKSFEQLTKTPESMKDTADQDDFKTDTQKIDGMEYDVEIFEKDGQKATFVYNDDGDLVFIISDDGTNEVSLEVLALDGNVKDRQFDVPSDYTVTQAGQQSSSSSGSSGTNNSTASGGTSGTPIGGDGTVVCKDGAYKFKTEPNYIAHVSGDNVDIYLEKENSIPVFRCYKMPRVNNQSADDFLDGTSENLKKTYKNRMANAPEKFDINVNGEKVRGIKYEYSSEDGSMSFTGENFAVMIGDNIYSWSSLYNKGDNVTPAEVQGAMMSFEEMR